MNKIKKYLIITILLIAYLIIGHKFKIYLFCPIHKITGLYCPGCGITRMLFSILKLDFYKAFRYNVLLFIMFPFALFLFIEKIYSELKKRKPLYKKIPEKVWVILIIILIIYAILRNIFPYLAPID